MVVSGWKDGIHLCVPPLPEQVLVTKPALAVSEKTWNFSIPSNLMTVLLGWRLVRELTSSAFCSISLVF